MCVMHVKVINALLENKLPANLQGVDRSLENAHDTSAGVNDNSTSLLGQRRNVFDGDEFDVFTRSDIDLGRVHQGKRDKDEEDVSGGLDDPEVRARYAKYAVQPVVLHDDDDVADVWEYDDEYDDTYDSNVVGARDADSADEMMMSRRPFVVPRVLADPSSDCSRADRYDSSSQKIFLSELYNFIRMVLCINFASLSILIVHGMSCFFVSLSICSSLRCSRCLKCTNLFNSPTQVMAFQHTLV